MARGSCASLTLRRVLSVKARGQFRNWVGALPVIQHQANYSNPRATLLHISTADIMCYTQQFFP